MKPFCAIGLLLVSLPTLSHAGSAYGRLLIECAAAIDIVATRTADGEETPAITNREAVVEAFLSQAANFDGTSFTRSYYPAVQQDWRDREKNYKINLEIAEKLEACAPYAKGLGTPYEVAD